jgi:hypothetical protein
VHICPECECVFDDPAEVCPHCNVPLVEKEEQEISDSDAVDENLPTYGLVVIESTCDELRVGQIRELLEDGGIPCFLSNELFPAQPPPSETMVMIPREMVSDAKRLMRDLPS